MQVLSQTNDIEPPSYEESLYFKKIDHKIKNHNKWNPLNEKDILLVPKNEKQSLYNNEKSLLQQLEKINNEEDHPFNDRLERVSSCLQQMIDEAKASLTSKNKNASNISTPLKKKKLNKRKSQQDLLDSQTRIANAIEQLNSTISQHISSTDSSTTTTPYEILEDYYVEESSRPSSPIIYHHHYHHYHHYYPSKEVEEEKEEEKNKILKKRKRSSSTSSSSLFNFWTTSITETTLLFGIFHYILSLSKPTSFLISMSWLVSLLLTKKKSLSSTRAFLNHFSFFMSQWLKRK